MSSASATHSTVSASEVIRARLLNAFIQRSKPAVWSNMLAMNQITNRIETHEPNTITTRVKVIWKSSFHR
ncbi:hypothetical protein D9M71_674570 [compost metagenome]